MTENPDHGREEVPGRPAVSPENTQEQAREGREQRAKEGRDLGHEAAPFLREGFSGAGERPHRGSQ
jgi:hypothetical protein